MLAKLMTKPSNLLVLDEPTNDLDAETLELLEDLVIEYPGTVLLVSHDREFLNNVVASTLVFEGDGVVKEYDGGYDDWVRQRDAALAADSANALASQPSSPKLNASSQGRTRKLSFKEQKELDSFPARIEVLEIEQRALHEKMAAPSFYQQPKAEITTATNRLEVIERELAEIFVRWEQLEGAGEGK